MTDTKTPLQILEDGRALIADLDRWIQGNYARKRPEDGVECFCSDGALLKADGVEFVYREEDGSLNTWRGSSSRTMDRARLILNNAAAAKGDPFKGDRWIIGYNDAHTHEEVLELWDAAIAEAKRLHEA